MTRNLTRRGVLNAEERHCCAKPDELHKIRRDWEPSDGLLTGSQSYRDADMSVSLERLLIARGFLRFVMR